MNSNVPKLLAALRSGEFEQTRGHLSKDGKYCCLGVACEVYQKDVGDLVIKQVDEAVREYDNSRGTLPEKVRQYFGFSGSDGSYISVPAEQSDDCFDEFDALTSKNDHGAAFEEIADIIESNPQGLFVPDSLTSS